jgi:3-deoxy-D-manno-octulosonic-acid transferase
MNFWKLLYNTATVPLLWILLQTAGLFNKKIKSGIAGRLFLFEQLEVSVKTLRNKNRLWFHSSSLGEFEQAKPIIQTIKKKFPSVDIITTFFSPSGFDHSKNYQFSDITSYIPFDSYANAKRFIELVKPTAAIMVRYDIWPNFIWRLKKNNTPTFIANATMSGNSLRKTVIAKQFHRSLYENFSHILTVSENDRDSFLSFGTRSPNIIAVGDTRFDQVMLRSEEARVKQLLPQQVIRDKKIFIAGQSWEEDEEVIIPALLKMQDHDENILAILVPHEPTVEHLEELESTLRNRTTSIRFSEITNYHGEKIILIDSVGVLVALYKYAHVVYIGGSFRQGIHNVLEPAVFGVPIIFGPKHTNSQEAVELLRRGGGFVIHDGREFYRTLRSLFENVELRYQSGKIAQAFVHEHCGATDRFLHYLEPFLKS